MMEDAKTAGSLCQIELDEDAPPVETAMIDAVRAAAEKAAEGERIPAWEALIVLSGDDLVHRLNRDFRAVDRTTDVLSFPANELRAPLASLLAEGFAPELSEDGARIALGELYISVEQASRQAEEYGNTLAEELRFLAVHGMLHLLGYDHMTQEDELLMRQKQREALGRV